MTIPVISIIVAMDEKGGIGKEGRIPWHFPDDLKRFKRVTTGHVVIMGRKTFESILNYLDGPLPKRTNIVITRNKDYVVPGVHMENSLEGAINYAKQYETGEIFIIGGGQIFAEALPQTQKLYITHVAGDYKADTFFPVLDYSKWQAENKEDHPGFSFVTYVRRG